LLQPGRSSPEIPLLGPQSGKAVTPLDSGRFQSKVFRSVLDEMKPKENQSTPKQNQEGGKRKPVQKEPALQLDTPSRFLVRDQLFRPSFNIKVRTRIDVLGDLETPGGRSKPGERVETPLTDVVNRNLKVALANSSRSHLSGMQEVSASPQLVKTAEKEVNCPSNWWACDNTVTHYIYQGRVGDTSREYKAVKERALHVVSQYWLLACAEEQRHVPESLYPFTYNPKMSLNLSQVPSSSQRSPPLTRTQLKDTTESRHNKVGRKMSEIFI
ncbi:hypothetical protein GOODEAATRI_002971, partial [Goodea atripinnis]